MVNVEKAVLLAAGLGSRLGGAHQKSLTPVNGIPILHRALCNLASVGVREAVIVVGDRADEVMASVGEQFAGLSVTYVKSDLYRTTNNSYSLWLARHHLDQDVFLLEGDVLFDTDLLLEMSRFESASVVAVSPWVPGMEGTVAELDIDRRITSLLLREHQGPQVTMEKTYKTVNVHLLRRTYLRGEFLPFLRQLIQEGGHNDFYDSVLVKSVKSGRFPIQAMDCRDVRWAEVDDPTDLELAEYLFSPVEERLDALQDLHGGYWRYNSVVDHNLLHNPYFPPPALIDRLGQELHDAVIHYPPGRRTLERILTSVVRQPPERIVIANGACELITALSRLIGNVVVVVPGFNEYEAAFREGIVHRFELEGPSFTFDVEALCRRAVEVGAEAVIVTTPNNTTSMAVPADDLIKLSEMLLPHGILLVVDESFIDFSPGAPSLEGCVGGNLNVVIVKSMSKVYGIAGLRLGYALTSDPDIARRLRKQLPIWNINGIAESFLRVAPRFEREFRESCHRVRATCDELYQLLLQVEGLHACKPDANFVLVRVPTTWTGREVMRALFTDYGIFTKECLDKTMAAGERYLRLASRTASENRLLVAAIEEIISRRPFEPSRNAEGEAVARTDGIGLTATNLRTV